MTSRTELQFSYVPASFFEAQLELQLRHGRLVVNGGKATYTLVGESKPVPAALREDVIFETSNVFKLRQMIVNMPVTISSPAVVQIGEGGTEQRSIQIAGVAALGLTGQLTAVKISDGVGTVVVDTRAERIQEHEQLIASLVPKMSDATLRSMVNSYCQASEDPGNSLIHLYEVRDAANQAVGNEDQVIARFNVSKKELSKFRHLANNKPVRQGRHRGLFAADDLRDVTPDELDRARNIARRIIEGYAAGIPVNATASAPPAAAPPA